MHLVGVSESNIMLYVICLFTFFQWAYALFIFSIYCFSPIFFTCIVQNDVDLLDPIIFLPKASGDEGVNTQSACLYHHRKKSVHVTDGVTVTSLSASLQQDQ